MILVILSEKVILKKMVLKIIEYFNRYIDILKFFLLHSILNEYVAEWKSKGLCSESFKVISTSDNSLNPTLNYYGTKIRVKFTGDCLIQQKTTYNHQKVVNIYIFDSLGASSSNYSDPTIRNCLFGVVTLTKKHRY